MIALLKQLLKTLNAVKYYGLVINLLVDYSN